MKKELRQKVRSGRVFQDRVSSIIIGVIVVAMIAKIVILVRQSSTTPASTGDYEGIIVDRWADYAETSYGSKPRLALVIELADGKRRTVGVEPTVYESARVGMRIRSKSGQVVLIESNPAGK